VKISDLSLKVAVLLPLIGSYERYIYNFRLKLTDFAGKNATILHFDPIEENIPSSLRNSTPFGNKPGKE